MDPHRRFSRPAPAPATPFYFSFPPTPSSSEPPCLFLKAPTPALTPDPAAAAASPSTISAPPFKEAHGPLDLKVHCELPAVARGCARDSFAVLLRAKAPGASIAREAWIAVACPHPDVRIKAIKSSGSHNHDESHRLVACGRAALLDVGEIRADEERRFILFVNVPSAADDDDEVDVVTRLVRVSCTYKDSMTGKWTTVTGEDAVVRRPVEVTSQEDQKPSMEVQVERFRLQAATGPFATFAGNGGHGGFARKIPSASWARTGTTTR